MPLRVPWQANVHHLGSTFSDLTRYLRDICRDCSRLLGVVARASVSTGVAMSPSGSLEASPTRTEPTSTPMRAPRTRPLTGSAARLDSGDDRGERVGARLDLRAATLRDVVLATTATAEDRGRDLDQGASAHTRVAGASVRPR